MIVAAICALIWIFLGVAIMIALKSEKKRRLKHMRRAGNEKLTQLARGNTYFLIDVYNQASIFTFV